MGIKKDLQPDKKFDFVLNKFYKSWFGLNTYLKLNSSVFPDFPQLGSDLEENKAESFLKSLLAS